MLREMLKMHNLWTKINIQKSHHRNTVHFVSSLCAKFEQDTLNPCKVKWGGHNSTLENPFFEKNALKVQVMFQAPMSVYILAFFTVFFFFALLHDCGLSFEVSGLFLPWGVTSSSLLKLPRAYMTFSAFSLRFSFWYCVSLWNCLACWDSFVALCNDCLTLFWSFLPLPLRVCLSGEGGGGHSGLPSHHGGQKHQHWIEYKLNKRLSQLA